MSIHTESRYSNSLLFPQKTDSKYSIPSLSKESVYHGHKQETQSYANYTASFAARGLGAGIFKQTISKQHEPLSSMPPINNKKADSLQTSNYPSLNNTSKAGDARELNKRSMAPSPQAQGRAGVSMDRSYGKEYSIKTYQSALGGQVTAAAIYANERSGTYGERKFIGIAGNIKPATISSNSSRRSGQYVQQQSEHQDDIVNLATSTKVTKAQAEAYARSGSRYSEPYYVGHGDKGGDAGNEKEGSSRLGASILANEKSIGMMQRLGESEKGSSDAYSRRTASTLQSNNYMNSSSTKSQDNDNYGSKTVLNKNDVVTIKPSAAWVSSEPKGLVGLRNIGNTCFMNSILQCLFNTPGLSDFLASGKHMDQINRKREKGIARAFADILVKIRSHTGSPSYSAESTSILKRRIEESNSMFSGYEQHDAQEFLKALLEGIHEDLNRVNQKPPYKELTADVSRPLQAISTEWYDYMLGRDNSVITDLFSGQLLSRTTCTHCQYESLAFDNFWDLSLSFTRGLSILGGCDLIRMIEHFLKEELLDDLFNCERCKQKRKFKKCFVIWRLPKVLVIHLKRFHYGKYKKEKITQKVKFPVQDLDLSDFVKESKDISVKDARYSLFGIVNHSGSLNGGHYTAECMNGFNRNWYNFNDSSVRESHSIDSKDKDASGDSPYMLFYVKK